MAASGRRGAPVRRSESAGGPGGPGLVACGGALPPKRTGPWQPEERVVEVVAQRPDQRGLVGPAGGDQRRRGQAQPGAVQAVGREGAAGDGGGDGGRAEGGAVLTHAVGHAGAEGRADVGGVEEQARRHPGPGEACEARLPGVGLGQVAVGVGIGDGGAAGVAEGEDVGDGDGGVGEDPELVGEAAGGEEGLGAVGDGRDPGHEGAEAPRRRQARRVGAAGEPHVACGAERVGLRGRGLGRGGAR